MAGLFSSPNAYQQEQNAALLKTANDQADWTPNQWANYGMSVGGQTAAKGLRSVLGIKDPELERLAKGREMLKNYDTTDPESMLQAAKDFGSMGMHDFGEQAFNKAKELLAVGKTKAEVDKLKAEAKAKGQAKQSSADIAARRALITKVEQRLADGENITDKDPDLIQARAALAIETKPQYLKQDDGSVLPVPGLDAATMAPLLGKRLSGSSAAPTTSSISEEHPDVKSIDREISRLKPGTPGYEDSLAILQNERKKLLSGVANPSAPYSSPTTTATNIIQTPTSIRRAEERKQADVVQAEGIDKSITTNNNVISSVDRAINQANKWSTGLAATVTKGIGVSPAGELKTELDFIRNNLTIDTINQMKQQSRTGATGFGALSEKELNVVQNAIVSMNQDNSPENVKRQLGMIKEHLALANQYLQKHKEALAAKGATSSVAGDTEALIQRNMKANPGRSRQEIIDALRAAGKL